MTKIHKYDEQNIVHDHLNIKFLSSITIRWNNWSGISHSFIVDQNSNYKEREVTFYGFHLQTVEMNGNEVVLQEG